MPDKFGNPDADDVAPEAPVPAVDPAPAPEAAPAPAVPPEAAVAPVAPPVKISAVVTTADGVVHFLEEI